MPKRSDLSTILVIGAGPIVIGQACEFDYSGVQAIKALKAEGYRVVLVNSNPATIMTDPDLADATYIEPITPDFVAKIIEKERHVTAGGFALLPTMGGQTALNTALALHRSGFLDQMQVELIGADATAIDRAEDRLKFRDAMSEIGLESPRSKLVRNWTEAEDAMQFVGLPCIIRPSFTLGGTGGGIAYNGEEFREICLNGLSASPVGEILVEESVLGWKEYEMEVVRDRADNAIIVCSIENLDPMGVHTGDSITIAPALTLSDKEYQRMRNASIAVLRKIGVETGGSNVQFAINPKDGRMVVIEMNPRVSRSSALASKATGFPIAKIAAKLAVGYTLDELSNDITKSTPASFEPSIDYVVTKIPRFAFEKYRGADPHLTTSMKSVGEVMAIGRCFAESFQKALRGLETGLSGLDEIVIPGLGSGDDTNALWAACASPTPDRVRVLAQAMRHGLSLEEIHCASAYDPWFLGEIYALIEMEAEIRSNGLPNSEQAWRELKACGFSDARLASLSGKSEQEIRKLRWQKGVRPVFKQIDTCAGEFASLTPYLYSTYETGAMGSAAECEAAPSARKKVMILGGGPNRIGQGIEFDYCCCHAAFAAKDLGIESIMVNCNPETVSTDYDTSDRLYFEPLTLEDVLEIVATEQKNGTFLGVIVQFGGQTPLKLAQGLADARIPILGTSPERIDLAEDREKFSALIQDLGLRQAPGAIARSESEAIDAARQIGFPVMLRPSFVLGGRAMEIIHDEEALNTYVRHAVRVSGDTPLLVDRYLQEAIEIDVDALVDSSTVIVAGIMEHIEEAGVHSGDSACALPPYSLQADLIAEIKRQTTILARALHVSGLVNIQFAYQGDTLFVLEANPRASRTVPFVAKAIGAPVAAIAAKVMMGAALAPLWNPRNQGKGVAVKEAVFPFARFPGVDPVLGPEMRSTGEAMGLDDSFASAFLKSQIAAGVHLPRKGKVFISVKGADKPGAIALARELVALGFEICATSGTASGLRDAGVPVERVNKVLEGRRHIVDEMIDRQIDLVFNTTEGAQSMRDSSSIRRTALAQGIPYYTTLSGAKAAVQAIRALHKGTLDVRALQSYYI